MIWNQKTGTSPWCFRTMRSIRTRLSRRIWVLLCICVVHLDPRLMRGLAGPRKSLISFPISPVTPASGVRVTDTFLTGYAYAANFGWINFGDGAPANGYSYANTTGTNFGVNLSLSGDLSGYAYGANIGWIQFEQTQGQPRLNLITGEFTGHAYSANMGWIALDTTLYFSRKLFGARKLTELRSPSVSKFDGKTIFPHGNSSPM